jgi:hypothetical protein
VEQLRHDIDSGRTADKVAHFDPAAAPLGADEEAAGTPLSAEAITQARAHETGRLERMRRDADGAAPEGRNWRLGSLTAAAVLVLIVVLAMTG